MKFLFDVHLRMLEVKIGIPGEWVAGGGTSTITSERPTTLSLMIESEAGLVRAVDAAPFLQSMPGLCVDDEHSV